MNRRQLSQESNALSARIEEIQTELDKVLDASLKQKVSELSKLIEEREKLRGEHTHLTRTMQQRGLLL